MATLYMCKLGLFGQGGGNLELFLSIIGGSILLRLLAFYYILTDI